MTYAWQIARDVWADLGMIAPLEEFLATGGNTTTIVNAKWGDRPSAPTDDYALDYTAIVVRDADGASAAPEGQMQRVSLYNSETYTYTVDTAFTAGVASGDLVALANAFIPLREMMRAMNRGLQDIGYIENVDATLTATTDTYEYTLPVELKREEIRRLEWDNGTYKEPISSNFDVRLSAPGSTGVLIISEPPAGTLYIRYDGIHPQLTAYNSYVSETINPTLVVAAASAHALEWYNSSKSGNDAYWLQRENKAWQDLENARARYPVTKTQKTSRFFVLGQRSNRYPGDQSIYNR